MNIDFCKKCHLHPYLVIWDFSGKNTEFIRYMIVCCGSRNSVRANMTAEITETTFNRLLKDLTDNGYKFIRTGTTSMINLSDIRDKNLLYDIEINNLCRYYLENEIEFLNNALFPKRGDNYRT